MGYLGSSLDDYFSYQLIEKVIDQIDNRDTGDKVKLHKAVSLLVEKLKSDNSECTVTQSEIASPKLTS